MSKRWGPGYNDGEHQKQAISDVAESNGHLILCRRCEGTGNQLFSMFQICTDCDGVGAVEVVDEGDSA